MPFSAALLEEIRACLRVELLGEKATGPLTGLIGSWGPAAEAAIPDLLDILPRHADRVGFALADIAGATPEAISLLRQAGANLDAAARLHALTGDEEPLLVAAHPDDPAPAGLRARSPRSRLALLRIDPETHGGIPLAALAGQLLTRFGSSWSITQMAAVQVLGEIGLPRLPAHVVARLRELATQDRRNVDSGVVQAYIRDDDELRAAILDLIGENGEPAGT